MVDHLLEGLGETLPTLTPREALYELLTILTGVVQTFPSRTSPRPEPLSSRGAPPMT